MSEIIRSTRYLIHVTQCNIVRYILLRSVRDCVPLDATAPVGCVYPLCYSARISSLYHAIPVTFNCLVSCLAGRVHFDTLQ